MLNIENIFFLLSRCRLIVFEEKTRKSKFKEAPGKSEKKAAKKKKTFSPHGNDIAEREKNEKAVQTCVCVLVRQHIVEIVMARSRRKEHTQNEMKKKKKKKCL